MKPNKIYLIHHSHTDIGYTEQQDVIMSAHADYIKQAIRILDNTNDTGFIWQCENHWQVENFYKQATRQEKQSFEQYVREGKIGLSAHYLNLTELADEHMLDNSVERAVNYGKRIDCELRSAMAADVNGFSWGYADTLYKHGVENLFACVHTHHGLFPGPYPQYPFWWKTAEGNKILVWSGEHYNLANEFNLAPNASASYMVQDHYGETPLYRTSKEQTEQEELQVLKYRINRYLNDLEQRDYPFSFVPLMISGTITDNAPPNEKIPNRLKQAAALFDGAVTFEMITLEHFFQIVRETEVQLPIHTGDWNDWWSDGIGSTPKDVQVFRRAQRYLQLCNAADPNHDRGKSTLIDRTMENLLLYAEHTWGYSSSVQEPWSPMVTTLESQKSSYAAAALSFITQNLELVKQAYGARCPEAGQDMRYRLINPYHDAWEGIVHLDVQHWEYLDGIRFREGLPVIVMDITRKKQFPHTICKTARGFDVIVPVTLPPCTEITLQILPDTTPVYQPLVRVTADGVNDLSGNSFGDSWIETPYLRVEWDKYGISEIFDIADQRSILLSEAEYPAFSGIYEKTPGEDMCLTRKKMGRSRKAPHTKRYVSRLVSVSTVTHTPVYHQVVFDHQLEGTKLFQVVLTVYSHQPRLDVKVRLHKTSEWLPENLYFALPFSAGVDEARYLEKAGALMRPGIDQLPGGNQSFYTVGNGVFLQGEKRAISLLMPDTPLVTFGKLSNAFSKFYEEDNWELNRGDIYSWMMNNYWETNFNVDLGGFYELNYSILLHQEKREKHTINSREILQFRV